MTHDPHPITHDAFAYEVLKTFALTHNYNKWIVDLLRPFIGKNILEVGCGIGNLSRYLKNLGKLSCLDKSEYFLQHMKIDYPELNFYHLDISDTKVRSLKGEKFDTIICVNVLEHIEDDEMALLNMYHILNQDGRLLLLIPAMPALYNILDARLGHFRRYDKGALEKKIIKAGFGVEEMRYLNLVGMIGWFVRGKFYKKEPFPVLSTLIFDKLVGLWKIGKFVRLPIGMSLFSVASKH